MNTKFLIIGGIVLVVVVTGIALGVTLHLTVFKNKEEQAAFKGSDVLDEVPLVDGHNDLPWNLYNREKNLLENFDFTSDLRLNPRWADSSSHTDLLRLREGKLGGQFWVAYASCDNNHKDAVERTLEQIDVIKRLVDRYPNDMMYVTEADQIMEAFNQKKIASMIEIEGGHSIDSRLSVLRMYHDLGVRCMTLTHSCNLPWADASPIDDDATAIKRGLTDWGKSVIAEMNRVGIIIDLSHVSEGVMLGALENSKAQVLFSHSSSYTIFNHHRNVKDHVLLKVKENNGLVMVNFYSAYIAGVDSTIDDVIKHINHIRDLIGPEHVGIGGDYDGVNMVPTGLEDVSKYPDLFDRLAEEGHGYEPWSKEDLKKLAGENLIRVFKDVERVRDSLVGEKVIDDPIPYDDIKSLNPDVETCRTDIEFYNPVVTFRGRDVLDEVPLIDGHNDLPWNIYNREKNLLENFEFNSDLRLNPNWQTSSSHTDLLRLREGKLGGQFWVAYVSCNNNYKDAVERTLEQIDVIKRLITKYSDDMMYVTEADQIMEAFNKKKIASMIEIEGGHSIDSRLSVLRMYHELGVRCMTLTHSCNLPWADASPIDDQPSAIKKDLTDWGKSVVAEMNRLGIIIDLSHVSEGVMLGALEHSKAQLIFSHSSAYAIQPHNRNVKDHVLLKVKEKNGLVMINFYSAYIGGNNTIYDVINHINYIRDLIGPDHIGIGGDYDGVSRVPQGLEDVSKYPDLFDILAEDGHGYVPWTKDDLKKLAGLNLIRVFKDVERVRDSLKNEIIIDQPVPYNDIVNENPEVGSCRTDIESYKPQDTLKSKLLATLLKVEEEL